MRLDRRRAVLSGRLWLCLLVLAGATGSHAQTLGGPLPGPLPLFPPSNWWNLDVSSAPLDPNSAAYISFIGGDILHPDFGGTVGGTGGVEIYGLPYIVVSASQPKRTVTFSYADESDHVGYPIPDQAITQPHWIEGGEPGNQDLRGQKDRHMLIVDSDNKYLYELYNVFWDGTKWLAASGAFFDMKTNNRRPEGWTSADAAGLAILPGLVRYDEVYGPDEIDHAFRVTLHVVNGHVFPASHNTWFVPGALPLGARLRLKASKDLSGLPPGVQKIGRAMKKYGLIVADLGTDMFVTGTFDTRWDNGVLNPAFAALTANDFEVVQLGYGSNLADLSITKTDGQASVVNGQLVAYSIVVSNMGPGVANGAVVTDSFPPSLTGVTWTCTAAGGASCIVSSGSGDISRTVNLPQGGSVTFVAVGKLSAGGGGTLDNTATVSAPSGAPDQFPADNTATDSDTIIPGADLTVTKTDGQATAVPGQVISYTITVTNSGPNPVSGVTVSDPATPSLTGVAWTCSPSGGASCGAAAGPGDISDTVDLPVGGTVTYTLSGTLVANPQSLSNTAAASLPAGYGDPNPDDNSSTDTDILLCGNTTSLVPDGRVVSTTLAPGATQWLLLQTHTASSYSVEVKNRLGSSSPGTVTLFRGDDGCTLTSTATSRSTSSIDPAAPTTAARLAFTSSGSDPGYRLRLTNNTGGSVGYDLSLAETTLFSPAWSTNGSYNTYYSLQNTTGSTITATLSLTRTDGTSAGSSTLSIPARATAATNTASLSIPRNSTGTARLTHDGPPGALLAEAAIANFSTSPAYIQPVKFKTVRETR
jgi:uncharacterized repeat protein (TIGR01451 family)